MTSQGKRKIGYLHVISPFKTRSLRARLKSGLVFAHNEYKKDFSKLMSLAIRVLEAFQHVENGPKKSTTRGDSKNGRKNRDGNHKNHTVQFLTKSQGGPANSEGISKTKGPILDFRNAPCNSM